jgi:hypothetical protein
MPVIPSTQEAIIRRFKVSPSKKVSKTPILTINTSVVPTMWEEYVGG